MLEKIQTDEKVEAIIIENFGRTIRQGGQVIKKGGILKDPYNGESYPIVTKPLLAYRKNKSTPVYLIDRDAGFTVTLTTESTDKSSTTTIEIPKEYQEEEIKWGGCTCEIHRDPETVAKLSCDPLLGGRVMESTILQDEFGTPLTGSEKIKFILAGMVICFILLKMLGG